MLGKIKQELDRPPFNKPKVEAPSKLGDAAAEDFFEALATCAG